MFEFLKKHISAAFGNEHFVRNVSRGSSSPLAVLTYHDLSDDDDYSSWLRVKKSNFEAQMISLKAFCNFIRPEDLVHGHGIQRGKLNILLTFDDGFVNNYSLAFPLLKKLEIPALFFISTWNMQTGEPFWFDRVVCPIQEFGIYSLDLCSLGLNKYRFFPEDGPRRWDDIQRLLEDLKSVGSARNPRVGPVIEYLNREFPDGGSELCRRYRPLNVTEMIEMQESGLCHFGSHAHFHEILTGLDESSLVANLQSSKSFLENALNESVTHFSYPNGSVDDRVKVLCREAGYLFGYLVKSGKVNYKGDPMAIPRTMVGGYDSVESLLWKLGSELAGQKIRSTLTMSAL